MENQDQGTKYCNTCGEPSPGNTNFCRYCGSRLEEEIRAEKPWYVEKTAKPQEPIEAPVRSKMVQIERKPLGNGLKVFLSILCAVLPGIGQVSCLILAILFMNTEGDEDRQSFGGALLAGSLVMFVLTCVLAAVLALTVYNPPAM